MEDRVESFDDQEVLEVPSANAAQTEGGEDLDTFDNPAVLEQEEKVEDEKTEVDKDSQVNLLDEQSDKDVESKSEKKDEEKKDDEEGADGEKKAEDGGKKEEEEKAGEEKPEAKKVKEIKGKLGEDEFGIPAEAEVSVRVKGKKETVTVQELMNNWSGQKNFDQEFSKLGEQKKEFEAKNLQLEDEVGFLKGHIESIVGILNDDKKNPMDALEYLLDTTGRDTLSYKKRVMETMMEEIESLQEMDEVERELYWKDQELSNLKKRQESSEFTSRQEQEQTQLRERVDGLREAQNVSEDDFVTAHEELEELGYKDITPEQVVDFAALKPHFNTSEELVSDYRDLIDPENINNLISNIAVDLKKGDLTKKDVKAMLEEEFGDTKELESLTRKASKKGVKTSSKQKYRDMGEDHVESFDDFDVNYTS